VCHRLADAAATRNLGRELAVQLGAAALAGQGTAMAPVTLLLSGDLGAGKTCLVQGLATGLGIEEAITSPTFALAQHYSPGAEPGRRDGGAPTPRAGLVHLDLYRLEQAAAADELLAQEEEEAAALGAVLAVEWPERLSQLPDGAWLLQLELADPSDPEAGRVARVTAPAAAPAAEATQAAG
jgi:tRNA threonylcarbamoyladenosine biosynthesis protein TsaE